MHEPVRYVQAKEFGEAEVWMNERLMRAAPQYFAEFITAFEDGEQRNTPQRGPVRRNAYPISASCLWLMRAPLAQLLFRARPLGARCACILRAYALSAER